MYYYSHHIGDFDLATRHLTRIERSIYRDLIEVYYDTEKQLTLDTPSLCRRIIARSADEVTAVEQVLKEFFLKTPDGWYHGRCETEIELYKKSTSQKALAGRASAAAKEAKRQQAINGSSTNVEQPISGTSTNHEPLTDNHEPSTKEGKTKPVNPPAKAEALSVFEYWKKVMNHPQAIFDDKREKLVRARLKAGYTVDQLCKAIDGCKGSPWHQGQNDRSTVYDDLGLILRDASKVDGFMALDNVNLNNSPLGAAGQKTAQAAQRFLDEDE